MTGPILVLIFYLLYLCLVSSQPCVPRKFAHDSFVCVCNATYCDFEPPKLPSAFQYYLYTSDRDGKRFHLSEGFFRCFADDHDEEETGENANMDDNIIFVNLEDPNQFGQSAHTQERVQGFGGSFSDSAGFNYFSLSLESRKNLIRSYFGPDGINYNLCRTPIAGTDFSSRIYTYDDVPGDTTLEHFGLTEEDYFLKIPMIQDANETSGGSLQLIASAWTAPPWMKDNNAFMGKGDLKHEYYQLYADYTIKFLDAYKEEGVDVWAITTGNEPINGLFGDLPDQFQFNCMGWSPFGMAKWVNKHMGPALKSSQHPTKLFVIDDQKVLLPWFLLLGNIEVKWLQDYVHGVAVHWYLDSFMNAIDAMNRTRKYFPNLQIVNTEACHGVARGADIVSLGMWSRGEDYAENIIDNMNVGMAGWIEYNLALNMSGGPTWNEQPLDAPIIVNEKTDEFYKQPKFYAIGHFSKFIQRGARVLKLQDANRKFEKIKILATLSDDGYYVVVFLNRNQEYRKLRVRHANKGDIEIQLSARSIATLIYQK